MLKKLELKLPHLLKSVGTLPCEILVYFCATHIHSSENNLLHVRPHLFHEFLFAYLFLFLTSVSLSRDCDILFVALFMPFRYEDKHSAQHWTTHILAHLLASDVQDWKHDILYMPKADILNTCCRSICVDRPRNIIPREHLLWSIVFASLWTELLCCKAV